MSGIITAFKTIPLNKVKIYAERSGETVFSSSDGQFSVNVSGKEQLILSAAGFYNKKIRIGDENIYKIEMIFINKTSNIQKAVSEGHIAEDVLRQALEGKVPAEEKDYSKYQTIFELIGSEIYNVRIKGNSVVNTRIRSFDISPQVLYVVDGKIVTDISYISPQYVKSIEFIDDVGTTAYGSKGANGVLKITLK